MTPASPELHDLLPLAIVICCVPGTAHVLRISLQFSFMEITYHAHRTWFDEDPSKGSKSIAIAADYNPIFRT
jgi:hypothetical protein